MIHCHSLQHNQTHQNLKPVCLMSVSTLSSRCCAAMWAPNDLTDHFHASSARRPHRAAHQASLPGEWFTHVHVQPASPRPWQQLVLRFGWELITSLWITARMRARFLKRSKVRFSFFGLLYFVRVNSTMLWSVPCVSCVPPAVFSAPPHSGKCLPLSFI